MQVSSALDGVENVEQAVLMASSGWSKDRALYESRVLRKDAETIGPVKIALLKLTTLRKKKMY